MMQVLFAFAASLLVLMGAQGFRMVRASVIDDYMDAQRAIDDDVKRGSFTRIIDRLGLMTQKLLVDAYGPRRVKRLAWQLRAAGQPAGLSAQLFIQREAGFATLGLFLMVLSIVNGQLLLGLATGIVFAGWMHAWLLLTVRDRQAKIERDLPDFLDVFAVTVSAGLPFRVALQRVAERHGGPLAEEMRLALREMQLGVSRREAMEGLRERSKSENMASFVTAFLQSEELGTPLEDSLHQISQEVRRQRSQQVRRAAAKAQPKVSAVVTFTIVPGAVILVAGGMLITRLDSLRGLFNG